MGDAGRLDGYAVISCAEVDSAAADEVQAALESAGVRVWRYGPDVLPGQDWRAEIRRAVSDGAFAFLVLFSEAGRGVRRSLHRDEFWLAVDELRLRPLLADWLIPVRVDDCEIPDVDLGGGRTLRSLKPADLFGPQRDAELGRLVKVVTWLAGDRLVPGLASPALAQRLLALKDRYVRGIEHLRPPNLAVLARPEVRKVVDGLISVDGPRVVVVTGTPGSGKSTVLAQACVQLAGAGVVVGPMRLDAAEQAWTAEDLGCQAGIGFGGPPAHVTSGAAGGGLAVLVVDQLDSLSLLSGRGETVLEGVRDMLAQARESDGLRVLIACRKYDFTKDHRLRRLVYDDAAEDFGDTAPDVLHVEVGDLDQCQVREALTALGFVPESLPPRFMELAASPFNLSLIATIAEDARAGSYDLGLMHDRHDLLDAYDTSLRHRARLVLSHNEFTSAVHRIAVFLSESGILSFARGAFADIPDTIGTLIHEGVLNEYGGRLRFFHDEYFSFVFARQHLQAGRIAIDLVRDDIQDIVRRGQVSAILAQQRRNHTSAYQADVRAVLDPNLTRSHLRAAVLAWLTDQPQAEDHELRLVTELAIAPGDPLRRQALWTLCSRPFGHALHRHGLLAAAAARAVGEFHAAVPGQLADLIRQLDAGDCAILLSETARHYPEEVSAELLRHAADPKTALLSAEVALRSVFLAGPAAGAATARLFCMVASTIADLAEAQAAFHASAGAATAYDAPDAVQRAVSALYAEHGAGVLALATISNRELAPGTRAVHAYLTAAARISSAHGRLDAFDTKGPLPYQRTGLDIYSKIAAREPEEFAATLTPFLLAQLELAADSAGRRFPAGSGGARQAGLRYDRIFGYGSVSHAQHDEFYDALRTALCWCASQAPEMASPLIAQLADTDLFIAHQLAAAALSTCAKTLLPAALSWASRPAVRGLGAGITASWAWGEVLAHLAATGDRAQQAAALDLAMQPYRAVDLDAAAVSEHRLGSLSDGEAGKMRSEKDLAVEQIVALALIERRLGAATPEAIKNRHAALVQILGPVAAGPYPQRVAYQLSPLPDDSVLEYSDARWEALLRHPAAGSDEPLVLPAPGVRPDTADQLEIAAKRDPARFARLLTGIGPAAHPEGIRSVLNAITSAAGEISAETVSSVVELAQAVPSWGLPEFNQSLCGLVSALANYDLPDEVIASISSIATTASDPATGNDPVAAGWATDQGQALLTLANLLAPPRTRQHRAHVIADALTAAADDPSGQAPAMLPAVLARICAFDAASADELTRRWLTKASDRSLLAPELDSLAWQLITQARQTGTDLARRMLGSAVPEVRIRGGALAAAISLHQIELPGCHATPDARTLLQTALNDPSARNGVAKLAARCVDDLPEQAEDDNHARNPDPAVDRRLLARLLNDPDAQVRESAASYPLHLSTPCDHAEWLLSATAASPAFAEHPASTLYLLRRPAAKPPVDSTLDICERWLSANAQAAGDIRTAAAGDGYHIVDIALAIHSRTHIGSDRRKRTLALLDRLIESGVINANSKVDAMGDIYI